MRVPTLDSTVQASSNQTTGAGAATPPESGARREQPALIIAECLALPKGASVTGRPLTLLDVLSSTSDRRQQLEAVHAYWRLTAALAEYCVSFDENQQLGRIEGKAADAAMVRPAKVSSLAAVRAAELAFVSAQYDLAEAAGLSAAAALPIPSDLPHVGTYRTYFDELFAARAAPGRTRLIHRTLPIRCQAIETQASAVQAAQDAMQATFDAYRAGEADWSAWLSTVRQYGRQRRLLIRTACDYNHDIADYAFAVAGPQFSVQDLVRMLIKIASQPAPKPAAAPAKGASQSASPAGVEQAGFAEPGAKAASAGGTTSTGTRPQSPAQQSVPQEPRTFVAPPNASPLLPNPPTNPAASRAADARPAASPMRSIVIPWGSEESGTVPTQFTSPAPASPASASPAPASPASAAPASASLAPTSPPSLSPAPKWPASTSPAPKWPTSTSPASKSPAQAAPAESQGAKQQTVHRLVENGVQTPAAGPLFSALADSSAAVRAKQLTLALHAVKAPAAQGANALDLRQCLQGVAASERHAVVEAFWLARQRAAEYQVIADQARLLDPLRPAALARRTERGGAAAMLRLHAAVVANRAEQARAQVRLLESQYELTRRTGRSQSAAWLLPATAPHSGPYVVQPAATSAAPAGPWRVRRPAATLPAWLADLQERAAATVQADAARAAAASAYEAGSVALDRALAAAQQQLDETLAFLDALTGYNRAIADYALTTIPASAPVDQVVKTLVVVK